MDTEKLKILASQLKNPHGEKGVQVAEMMYQTNLSMIKHALQYLDIADGDTVLEIGYGNGKQFLYRLNHYGITRDAYEEAVNC